MRRPTRLPGGVEAAGAGAEGTCAEAVGRPQPLSLFAYPAESNYSGARLDPRLAAAVKAPSGAGPALERLLQSCGAGTSAGACGSAGGEEEGVWSAAACLQGGDSSDDGNSHCRAAALGSSSKVASSSHKYAAARPGARAPLNGAGGNTNAGSWAGQEGASDSGSEGRECPGKGAAREQGTEGGAAEPSSRWVVAVDAAKACGTRPPDLSDGCIDFLVRLHLASSPRHLRSISFALSHQPRDSMSIATALMMSSVAIYTIYYGAIASGIPTVAIQQMAQVTCRGALREQIRRRAEFVQARARMNALQ